MGKAVILRCLILLFVKTDASSPHDGKNGTIEYVVVFFGFCSSKRSEDMNKQEAAQIMNRVYVEHGFDTGEDLMNRLVGLESLLSTSLTSNKEVKLLVIDSIAYLFRDIGDDDKASYSLVGRSMIFFRISSLLR